MVFMTSVNRTLMSLLKSRWKPSITWQKTLFLMMMRMVGTMVDIIVKKIDENMINNMPGGYILDKMNNQNGTSFRHDNVIFRSK